MVTRPMSPSCAVSVIQRDIPRNVAKQRVFHLRLKPNIELGPKFICCYRVSVRLSQVGVLRILLNLGSGKQHHTIARGVC